MADIKAEIRSPTIEATIEKPTFSADVYRATLPSNADVEEYKGDYEVTPRSYKQTLKTALKVMSNDVTIKEIPYKETPNFGGRGTTVRIG